MKTFVDSWNPATPFASNSLKEEGLRRFSREEALEKRWIQTTAQKAKNMIVVDVDLPEAASVIKSRVFEEEVAPEPAFITTNPGTTHAQAVFFIKGVITAGTRADHYLKSVTDRLTDALAGDGAYSGLIMRNPLTHALEELTGPKEWSLKELDDLIEKDSSSIHRLNAEEKLKASIEGSIYLSEDEKNIFEKIVKGEIAPAKKGKRLESEGEAEGRNTAIFELLRSYAYAAYRRAKFDDTVFLEMLEEEAAELNFTNSFSFKGQLPQSELNSVVKSVHKFVTRRFSEQGFRDFQARAAKKRWEKSSKEREERLEALFFLREEQGLPWEEIAGSLGGSAASLRKLYSNAKKIKNN